VMVPVTASIRILVSNLCFDLILDYQCLRSMKRAFSSVPAG